MKKKGFYLFDLKSQRIICSDSVTFDETTFPLAELNYNARMIAFDESGLFPSEDMISSVPIFEEIVDEVRQMNPIATTTPNAVNLEEILSMQKRASLLLPDLKTSSEVDLDDSELSEAETEIDEDSQLDVEYVFADDEEVVPPPVCSKSGRPIKPLQRYIEAYVCDCESCAFYHAYANLATSVPKQQRASARLQQIPYSMIRKDPELWKIWYPFLKAEVDGFYVDNRVRWAKAPSGVDVLPSMLLCHNKLENGQIVRLKARAVVVGSRSQKGVHYTETFSPTVDPTHVKIVAALAAVDNLEFAAFDATQAYLSAQPEATIYVRPPPGFEHPHDKSLVWILHSSQYGLPSSSRDFYLLTARSLTRQGFVKVAHDGTVWIRREGDKFIIALIYVDDSCLCTNKRSMTDEVVKQFAQDGINLEPGKFLDHDGATLKYV